LFVKINVVQKEVANLLHLTKFVQISADWAGKEGKSMGNRVKESKVYHLVKAIKETSDLKEVAKLLNSGNWIAIYATPENPDGSFKFVLGRL